MQHAILRRDRKRRKYDMERLTFTRDEKTTAIELARKLRASVGELISRDDELNVFKYLKAAISGDSMGRDVFGLNPIVSGL